MMLSPLPEGVNIVWYFKSECKVKAQLCSRHQLILAASCCLCWTCCA